MQQGELSSALFFVKNSAKLNSFSYRWNLITSIPDVYQPLLPLILANAFFIFLIYRIRFEPQVSTRDFGIVISIRNIISILLASLNCFQTYVNFYLSALPSIEHSHARRFLFSLIILRLFTNWKIM